MNNYYPQASPYVPYYGSQEYMQAHPQVFYGGFGFGFPFFGGFYPFFGYPGFFPGFGFGYGPFFPWQAPVHPASVIGSPEMASLQSVMTTKPE